MPPAAKSLAALVVAVAMVVAAVFGRRALDTKKVNDDLRLTVVCDPPSADFCRAAAGADARLTVRVESPDRTTKALTSLQPGQAPDFQAWVTVGPWQQMADGRRQGQPPLERGVRYVASTPIVLVTRLGQSVACGKPPAGCLPLANAKVGVASPRSSGVGLAGVAQVVMAATPIAPGDLDRRALESGAAGAVLDKLARSTNTGAGLEQLNAAFSQANPLVTTAAAATPAAGRAQVVRSDPPVRAVLQIGFLDPRAAGPLGSEAAGQALAKAVTAAGWEAPGDPAGGLPDPGVLAALQDAWTGPA
jgi:hypothetical protein